MEEQKDEKIGNAHLYELLTSREVSWYSIIQDLINTGQLDPWDIDLVVLSSKYLEKIRELEEANFFISSKVLLAASILLHLKSEILLNEDIRSIDDILFGRKEAEAKKLDRIQIDESEIPILYPKSPLPRMRKVSLEELMKALGKAVDTENRRIKREIIDKQAMSQAEIVLPRSRMNIRERIRKVYSKILTLAKERKARIGYKELVGPEREERIACFLPVLHLENQQRIWLEQENHFEEIYVWLYDHYRKEKGVLFAKELIEEEKVLDEQAKMDQAAGFENPMAGLIDGSLESPEELDLSSLEKEENPVQ